MSETVGLQRAPHRLHRLVIAVLLDDEELHATAVARLDQPVRFVDSQGQRLLDDHVLAGARGAQTQRSVRPARRADRHDVDGGIGKDRLIVRRDGAPRRQRGDLLRARGVGVACMDQTSVGQARHDLRVLAGDLPAPDDSDSGRIHRSHPSLSSRPA